MQFNSEFQSVQPPLKFLPSHFHLWVQQVVQFALPFWLQNRRKIDAVRVKQGEQLLDLYQQFQAGKTRFLLAFRHPTLDDPPCLLYVLNHWLPKLARQHNRRLQLPLHAHFLYDRGIPLWAGAPIGWLFSRIGATSIRRGRLDREGLAAARHLFARGKFPIAVAPEGSINGQNERVGVLEPGVAQLGFWCVEDLRKADRTEQVVVLPVGVQYHYVDPPWAALDRLLSELETDSGLAIQRTHHPELAESRENWFQQRLDRLSDVLLAQMEQFYNQFYHQSLTAAGSLSDRLSQLLNVALGVAEQQLKLSPLGSLIDRRHRIEQAVWERIYREDLPSLASLSPLERGLADRAATEAQLILWHMQWTESFLTVSETFATDRPTIDCLAETALLLWDFINRVKGSNLARPHLGRRWVQITIGDAISVSDRWSAYRANRRQALAHLTQELQQALERLIVQPRSIQPPVSLVK